MHLVFAVKSNSSCLYNIEYNSDCWRLEITELQEITNEPTSILEIPYDGRLFVLSSSTPFEESHWSNESRNIAMNTLVGAVEVEDQNI